MPDPPVSVPLAAALERGRERYNSLVAESVASGRRFDAEALAAHLRDAVSPAIDAIHRNDPAEVDRVADVLFRLSLDLVSRDLAGPETRHPGIAAGWRAILPAAAPLLARSPAELAGSLTNALYNVSVATGAAPERWIHDMTLFARHCGELSELLEAGKIAAWRSGLARYRQSALEACRSLSPDLGALALGVSGSVASWQTMIERLERDPWLDPAAAAAAALPEPRLRVVAVAGAFRGFGGPFRVPPKVYLRDGRFVAKDDESAWTLSADRFGSDWRRCEPDDLLARTFPDAAVDRDGSARIGRLRASVPDLRRPWTQAFDGTTLAVTLERSHRVWLLACTP